MALRLSLMAADGASATAVFLLASLVRFGEAEWMEIWQRNGRDIRFVAALFGLAWVAALWYQPDMAVPDEPALALVGVPDPVAEQGYEALGVAEIGPQMERECRARDVAEPRSQKLDQDLAGRDERLARRRLRSGLVRSGAKQVLVALIDILEGHLVTCGRWRVGPRDLRRDCALVKCCEPIWVEPCSSLVRGDLRDPCDAVFRWQPVERDQDEEPRSAGTSVTSFTDPPSAPPSRG
jgi:hypothetical protein